MFVTAFDIAEGGVGGRPTFPAAHPMGLALILSRPLAWLLSCLYMRIFLLITDKYAIYAPDSTLVDNGHERLMFLGLPLSCCLPITAGCALRVSVSQYLRSGRYY